MADKTSASSTSGSSAGSNLALKDAEPLKQYDVPLGPNDIDRNMLAGSCGLPDGFYRPLFVMDVGVPNFPQWLAFGREWIRYFNDVAVCHP
jgi:hypothetical protein